MKINAFELHLVVDKPSVIDDRGGAANVSNFQTIFVFNLEGALVGCLECESLQIE